MRFFIGFVGFPLGMLLMIYRERVKNFTGDFQLAEKWFGPGGTYSALIIIGLLISVGYLMYALGTLQLILSPFTGLFFTE